jgi:NAD-dependent SIR2 family protein deacetylase
MFSKKEETREPYSIEQCNTCKKETKRKFKDGDYVFKETSKCPSCEGLLRIVKVFGEIVKAK